MKVTTLDYVLVNEITALIKKNNWQEGQKLPSERELSEMFNVQRLSLRSALSILEQKKVIYSKPRSGYFVRERKIKKSVDVIASTSDEIKKSFSQSQTRIIKFEEVEIDKYLYNQMRLPLGTRLYEIKRLRTVNNKPVSVDYSFIPKAVAPNLTQHDLESRSLYHILKEEYGIHLRKSQQNITVIEAEENYAPLLEVDVGDDIVLQCGSVYDENDNLVEFSESYMIYNRFTYIFTNGGNQNGI